MNNQRSRMIAQWLVEQGCVEVVLCAGARNAPLLLTLHGLADSGAIKVWSFFEERSAAFFALGRIKALGRPVAVLTTSGTAVAELLPAVIEAHYEGQPLIVVSADRPSRFRGHGAPQTIEQVGLFSQYVECTLDFEGAGDLAAPHWSGRRPIHLNICLEEPKREEMRREIWTLAPREFQRVRPSPNPDWGKVVTAYSQKSRNPLVLVGPLAHSLREEVRSTLSELQRPIYAESLSGLTGEASLADLQILGGERCAYWALKRGWSDGVIRIGAVPTPRIWRDLEEMVDVPVLNFSDTHFSGLSRDGVWTLPLEALGEVKARYAGARFHPDWREMQLAAKRQIEDLLQRYPRSEPGLLASLARRLPSHARVYLGNSLPIREWESAHGNRQQEWWLEGNRGANGIDGQISTYLGFADDSSPSWAVLGDLTALYDLAALWALRQRPFGDLNLVIVNNGGGRIFERMYGRDELQSLHEIGFEHWAKMWAVAYEKWSQVPENLGRGGRGRVIELAPDEVQTADYWSAWEAMWRDLCARY